ncbi:MAG: zinc ribbon domain-containing protein [Syntrophaceae bacterium]|nr:zinc ribbon domain-containing protein [Syntrophaceae bacterium]
MPIFEYACRKCKHEFEVISFSSSSDSDVECPACGKRGAEKLMSAFSSPGVSGGGSSCSTCSTSSCHT